MNSADFVASLAQDQPPLAWEAPLKALWWDVRGDWQRAHAEVDELETQPAMRVHAYLHRKEGNAANAAYWYQRVNRPFPTASTQEEGSDLLRELLTS